MRARDRSDVLDELGQILARTDRVHGTLEVSSAVAGTQLSGWTSDHLDAIRQAALDLQKAVSSAPLTGD